DELGVDGAHERIVEDERARGVAAERDRIGADLDALVARAERAAAHDDACALRDRSLHHAPPRAPAKRAAIFSRFSRAAAALGRRLRGSRARSFDKNASSGFGQTTPVTSPSEGASRSSLSASIVAGDAAKNGGRPASVRKSTAPSP